MRGLVQSLFFVVLWWAACFGILRLFKRQDTDKAVIVAIIGSWAILAIALKLGGSKEPYGCVVLLISISAGLTWVLKQLRPTTGEGALIAVFWLLNATLFLPIVRLCGS